MRSEPKTVDSIDNFEFRVVSLRIANAPGGDGFRRDALEGLAGEDRKRVIDEAIRRQREAQVRREIAAGARNDYEYFLNSLAEALCGLPNPERGRRLRRMPEVLRRYVMPLIGQYQDAARDFLDRAGISRSAVGE
ncbi:MAG: hypothetical protein PHT60_14955 [Acidiphilium sp.]|nr:hypothetical protein [Acidiphilium sp.]MDD4937061.1 hypothetical protein [Acidiphilium sp.]